MGRYEAPNLRPGTYRIEVVTPNFKKVERPGVLLRAAGTALVDVALELGNVSETVTVGGEAINNITLESQAIVRGLDEQQLHDLPRSSRDIQSFLLLNPNVVGGSDDIQFLGAKTYGVSYIQDGQASTNAIFGTVGNSGIGHKSFTNSCGLLPPPREIDYDDLFPGATFSVHDCWQINAADTSSLEMYWDGSDSPGPWWALH